MLEIEFFGLRLLLLHSGAAFVPDEHTLLIADLHLGKINHFRREGIALPQVSNTADFDKIEQLLNDYPVRKVIFLGDLFHSVLNESFHQFNDFIKQNHKIDWHLILGNHDIIHHDLFRQIGVAVHQQSLEIDGVQLTHEPLKSDTPHICGHIHPVVKMNGKGRQRVRLRCFVKESSRIMLPAFGYFTGGFEVKPTDNLSIYPIAGEQVYSL